MAEPNPIWGLYAVPGSIAGALVAKSGDGYQVLDAFEAPAPGDMAGVRAALADTLQRAGVAGRAAVIAIGDHGIPVCIGTIPSDELYLNEDEVFHHLHDFAPFEPGEGEIVYRPVGRRDARTYEVAAVDRDAQAALLDLAGASDDSMHGIAFATPCLALGARALGLIAGRTFLVDVQATQTVVLAVDDDALRRYLVAAGLTRCSESMDAAELLARDIERVLAYHAEVACREAADDDAAPTGDVVLVGPNAARAHELLNRALGDRLAPASGRSDTGERFTGPDGGALAAGAAHVHAGSIGAALESFLLPQDRLVARHPPASVPAYSGPRNSRGRSAARRYGALGILVLAALGVGTWMIVRSSKSDPERLPTGRPTVTGKDTPRDGGATTAEPAAAGPNAAARDAAERERSAADARAAIGELALRVARARGEAAAVAALGSAATPHHALTFDVERVRGTLRFTFTASVDGGISPETRRLARAAIERFAGIHHVSIDIEGAALRVRFRADVGARPEAARGPREPFRGLSDSTDGAAELSVPLDAAGRPMLGDEHVRGLLAAARPGVDVVQLTASEAEFAAGLRAEASALLSELQAPSTPPAAAGTTLSGAAEHAGSTVTITLRPPATAATNLERRRLPAGDWVRAADVPEDAATVVDHVPGATGRYAWRLAGAEPSAYEADVSIPVEIAIDTYDPATGIVVVGLRRDYAGATVEASLPLTAGAAAAGATLRIERNGVTFDAEFVVTAVVVTTETETIVQDVPEFEPDGRVRRDADGRPVVTARPIERPVRVVEVRARNAANIERRWVRKMTDR